MMEALILGPAVLAGTVAVVGGLDFAAYLLGKFEFTWHEKLARDRRFAYELPFVPAGSVDTTEPPTPTQKKAKKQTLLDRFQAISQKQEEEVDSSSQAVLDEPTTQLLENCYTSLALAQSRAGLSVHRLSEVKQLRVRLDEAVESFASSVAADKDTVEVSNTFVRIIQLVQSASDELSATWMNDNHKHLRVVESYLLERQASAQEEVAASQEA